MSDLTTDPHDKAKAKGLALVLPEPDEIFVDLDDKAARAGMVQRMEVLTRFGFPVRIDRETVSPGGNAHVYLKGPRPLTPIEQIALQAILGSDPTREAFGFMRIALNVPHPPTCFFEKPAPAAEPEIVEAAG